MHFGSQVFYILKLASVYLLWFFVNPIRPFEEEVWLKYVSLSIRKEKEEAQAETLGMAGHQPRGFCWVACCCCVSHMKAIPEDASTG